MARKLSRYQQRKEDRRNDRPSGQRAFPPWWDSTPMKLGIHYGPFYALKTEAQIRYERTAHRREAAES